MFRVHGRQSQDQSISREALASGTPARDLGGIVPGDVRATVSDGVGVSPAPEEEGQGGRGA